MKNTNSRYLLQFLNLSPRLVVMKLVLFLFLVTIGIKLLAQSREGCERIDAKLPTLYLTIDTDHSSPQSVRLLLTNNITCSITITTVGEQLIVSKEGKQRLRKSSSQIIEDRASIALRYMILRNKQPWQLIPVWNYGHVVNESILEPKKTVGFIVPAKFLKNKGQIVVPFNYEWEGVLYNARASTLHLIYSPIKIM